MTEPRIPLTYDGAALVEFTILVGNYAMLAGLLNAAKVPRDAGVPFPAHDRSGERRAPCRAKARSACGAARDSA
jgi:hypothetical protein